MGERGQSEDMSKGRIPPEQFMEMMETIAKAFNWNWPEVEFKEAPEIQVSESAVNADISEVKKALGVKA